MTSKIKTPVMTSLCVVLLSLIFTGNTTAQEIQIQSKRVVSVTKTVVNMKTLAASPAVTANSISRLSKGKKANAVQPSSDFQTIPAPRSIQEVQTPGETLTSSQFSTMDFGGPLVPSPGPAQNFQGAVDEAVGGGPAGTFTIPPDTTGAVGLDKVVTILNNNLVIQDKATGAQLSLVGLSSFWTSTGATGVFDPRVLYDPYNNRWIVAAVSKCTDRELLSGCRRFRHS